MKQWFIRMLRIWSAKRQLSRISELEHTLKLDDYTPEPDNIRPQIIDEVIQRIEDYYEAFSSLGAHNAEIILPTDVYFMLYEHLTKPTRYWIDSDTYGHIKSFKWMHRKLCVPIPIRPDPLANGMRIKNIDTNVLTPSARLI